MRILFVGGGPGNGERALFENSCISASGPAEDVQLAGFPDLGEAAAFVRILLVGDGLGEGKRGSEVALRTGKPQSPAT